MKIMTVLGTRPEIIRLSQIIPKLDRACNHILVHTGQNFDVDMSDIFFQELNIRQPDHFLGVQSSTLGHQIGKIFTGIENIIAQEEPDRLLILGDTNSALVAFVAKRMGALIYHMEAGNRCFDDRVPEEVNRRVIDHSSDIHMPYTERGRANLIREGIASDRIFVVGNPIYEVLLKATEDSAILDTLDLLHNRYIVVTAHRQENVADRERLLSLVVGASHVGRKYNMPVIFSRHPRTARNMRNWHIGGDSLVFHKPFGFSDFLTLQRHAACVLTDSGTVQEECCILHVPCVTLRDTTERPETIECGSNILSGVDPENIVNCVATVLSQGNGWTPPEGYVVPNVSDTVLRIVTGYTTNPLLGRTDSVRMFECV